MISFIIPAFNVDKYILRTLESVLNQQVQDFEIIVVDDGSTDNTYEVVHKLIMEGNVNKIKLIRQENAGVCSARNRGLAVASGEYVIFLDADDYVAMNLIEVIKDSLIRTRPDILCWGYNIVRGNEILMEYTDRYDLSYVEMTGKTALEEIYIKRRKRIVIGNAAYRKDFLSHYNLEFTVGCSNGEDQEFIIKSLAHANLVVFLPQILFFYVQREDSISYTYNPKKFEAIDAVERAVNYINENCGREIASITSCFANEVKIENYMYNYNSSLEYLVYIKKLNLIKAVEYLNEDIKRRFPGLSDKMKGIMKKSNTTNTRLKIRLACFRISPILYYWIIRNSNQSFWK